MTQPYNRSFQGYGSAIGAGSHDNIPMLRDAQRPLSMDRCCYHFATQLDGTEQNELIRRRSYRCVLGPKILIEWHAIELGGMARAEFVVRLSPQVAAWRQALRVDRISTMLHRCRAFRHSREFASILVVPEG
jgi:hypothetical protein